MAQTNYIPDPSGAWPHTGMRCVGGVCSGSGAPTGGGFPGYIYTDEDTGDIYTFYGDTWNLFGGGGGGSGPDVHFGAFNDPNGNVSGQVDDLYKSSEALGGDGSLWAKRTGAGTSTGWE